MIYNGVHIGTLQLAPSFPTVNMAYHCLKTNLVTMKLLEMYSKQLTSLSNYTDCIEELFSYQIYNLGRIYVVVFLSPNKSIPNYPGMSNSNVRKLFA